MSEEAKPFKLPSTVEVVKAFPKEWYDPSEDEYWESYLTEEERKKKKQKREQKQANP